jgi:type II secretory ATPase GspE/PulE/Tfp pilus assembly ATPase PilB-like protein
MSADRHLGRTGVYELMPVTGPLRAALGANTDLAELRRQATRNGCVRCV